MLPKHPGLFVWLHLCDWLTVVAVLGFAKKKYVFFYEDMRSVKEKTWTRELEGLKHPKWELHEAIGYDNWPTITYLSTVYVTLLTLEAQFFGSWESMQISHETLVTFTLWSLAQASKNSSLPRFWTLLWRTPSSDGGSSGRLLKKLKWLSDLKSFSTSFPNCVSLSLFFGRTCSQILSILQLSKGKCSSEPCNRIGSLGIPNFSSMDSSRPKEQCREASCHAEHRRKDEKSWVTRDKQLSHEKDPKYNPHMTG